VADFGMSRIVERDQTSQVYVGASAVAYMAPELFPDPLGAGPQSDLYALGIVLYELLTRKIPGRRSPLPSQLVAGLPSALDDIFDRLTRDAREERFRSAAEVLDEVCAQDELMRMTDWVSARRAYTPPAADLRLGQTGEQTAVELVEPEADSSL